MTSTPTESKHLLAAKALLELFRANYQAKKDRLEGAESLLEQYFPKKKLGAESAILQVIKTHISEAFKRNEADEWSYEEQCLLLQISRRTDVENECRQIIAFKANARYFPESISKLLRTWTEILDRARNAQGPTVEPPSRRSLEDERKRISKRLEELRPRIKADSTFSDAAKQNFKAEIARLTTRDEELKKILGQAI